MTQRDLIHIILDDVGCEQLAAYSSKRTAIPAPFRDQYATEYPFAHCPTLVALAENGITYTQARTSPICSPTRAATLCGLYPFKNGTGAIVRGGDENNNNVTENYVDFLNQKTPELRTIAHHLSANGYTCQAFGKWHLYLTDPADASDLEDEEAFEGSGFLHPTRVCGFDEWSGTPRNLLSEGGTSYVAYRWYEYSRVSGMPADLGIVDGPYVTQRTFEDAAAAWSLAKLLDADRPVFQWIALNAAHSPWNDADWPPNNDPESLGRPEHEFDTNPIANNTDVNTRIRAQLEHFDYWLEHYFNEIGYDPANPTADDPVVFVWGDNGTDQNSISRVPGTLGEINYNAAHPGWTASWGSYTGTAADTLNVDPYDSGHFKGSTFEQGIRVPLLVAGNSEAITRSNAIDNALIDMVDFFATSCALGDCLDGAYATGTITVTNEPADESTFSISDGAITVLFEFSDNPNGYYLANANAFEVRTSASNEDTAINIRNAINASDLKIHATSSGAVVTLTHKHQTYDGNQEFTTTGTTNCTFVNLTGGASQATATDGVDFSSTFTTASTSFGQLRGFSYAGAQYAPNGISQRRRQDLGGFIRADGLNLWKRNNAQRSVNEAVSVGFYNVGNPASVAGTGTIAFAGALTAGDTIIISDNILHDDADAPMGNEVTFVAGTDFTAGVSAIADMTALVAAIVASALDITPTDNLDGTCSLVSDTAAYCNNDPIRVTVDGGSVITATGMSGGVAPDPRELCDLNSTAYVAANGTHPELAATETLKDQTEGRVDSPSRQPRAEARTLMTRGSQLLPL